jgi:hypothetical protein
MLSGKRILSGKSGVKIAPGVKNAAKRLNFLIF